MAEMAWDDPKPAPELDDLFGRRVLAPPVLLRPFSHVPSRRKSRQEDSLPPRPLFFPNLTSEVPVGDPDKVLRHPWRQAAPASQLDEFPAVKRFDNSIEHG